MKASLKKLLPLTLCAIAVTSLFSIQPAQAYTVTLEQVGSNVVATGSGAINLTGLSFNGPNIDGNPRMSPVVGGIGTGPVPVAVIDSYSVIFTGPSSFGSGIATFASSGSGNWVFWGGRSTSPGILEVPHGYTSGSALSSSATWDNATFASLGVTPGTYTWTWGTGIGPALANQSFTLIVEGAGVPDGGSTVSLLGCALLGLTALRRKLGW